VDGKGPADDGPRVFGENTEGGEEIKLRGGG